MNKTILTNLIAIVAIALSYTLPSSSQKVVLFGGLFALSGAVTNQIAIYMLFERVPGLYGSGVIERNFKTFKDSIGSMVMKQFFTKDKVSQMISSWDFGMELEPIVQNADFTAAFDALTQSIMESKFGAMVQLVGGEGAIESLKEPFVEKLKSAVVGIVGSSSFQDQLKAESMKPDTIDMIILKINDLIETRLESLTPQMVKELVQNLIRKHMGWLVVWGGVFGGLIGALSALLV